MDVACRGRVAAGKGMSLAYAGERLARERMFVSGSENGWAREQILDRYTLPAWLRAEPRHDRHEACVAFAHTRENQRGVTRELRNEHLQYSASFKQTGAISAGEAMGASPHLVTWYDALSLSLSLAIDSL